MSRSDPLEPFRIRCREIGTALDRAASQKEARDVKRSIIDLYHALDEMERRFGDLKGDLRELIDRYRALPGGEIRPAAGLPPVASASVASGLGSSTLVEKAWNCIAIEDYEGATRFLHRALELAPGDPRALSALGWVQMVQEDYDDALLTHQQLLVVDPEDAPTRVNLGYICLKKGIFGEAIEHLSRAIRSRRDREATLYAHYYLGLVYLAREMYRDAEAFFERTVELRPEMSEAFFQLGRARYLSGRERDALEAWKRGADATAQSGWGERCARVASAVSKGERPRFD